jgi:hypothetical protein
MMEPVDPETTRGMSADFVHCCVCGGTSLEYSFILFHGDGKIKLKIAVMLTMCWNLMEFLLIEGMVDR